MAEYPYINTMGKLQEFINKIPNMSVPESVSTKWLPTVGFGSANHRPIIKIMQFIGFADGNKPTQRWLSFRDNTQAKRVIAEGIAAGYSDLFSLYEDAFARSDEELKNFFKGKMTGGEQVITNTVSTFKVLCSFADFSQVNRDYNSDVVESSATSAQRQSVDNFAHDIPMHINIQVHIDASASSDQIESIFANMAKYLFNRDLD